MSCSNSSFIQLVRQTTYWANIKQMPPGVKDRQTDGETLTHLLEHVSLMSLGCCCCCVYTSEIFLEFSILYFLVSIQIFFCLKHVILEFEVLPE